MRASRLRFSITAIECEEETAFMPALRGCEAAPAAMVDTTGAWHITVVRKPMHHDEITITHRAIYLSAMGIDTLYTQLKLPHSKRQHDFVDCLADMACTHVRHVGESWDVCKRDIAASTALRIDAHHTIYLFD